MSGWIGLSTKLFCRKGEHACVAPDCGDFQNTYGWRRNSSEGMVQDLTYFQVKHDCCGAAPLLFHAQAHWWHLWQRPMRPGSALLYSLPVWHSASDSMQHVGQSDCTNGTSKNLIHIVRETPHRTCRTERSSWKTITSRNIIGSVQHL